MVKGLIFSIIAICCLLLAGCQSGSESLVITKNHDLTISMAIPCRSDEGAVSSRAEVVVTGEDFETIIQQLTVENCKVVGIVKEIPAGSNRDVSIRIYDENDDLLYYGSTTVAISSGEETDVVIKLKRATGSINVTGIMCEDEEPESPYSIDDFTLALYHFNETEGTILFDETGKWNGTNNGAERLAGQWGNCLKFTSDAYARFDTIITDGLSAGTAEFYVRFDDTMDFEGTYGLFGNDGSRILFLFRSGELIFFKNHSNTFKFIRANRYLYSSQWYHIAGTWGPKGMRLFIDGNLIASNTDEISVYQSSPRGTEENVFYIGKKSGCCMEGAGITKDLTINYPFIGMIDEVRISSIERY